MKKQSLKLPSPYLKPRLYTGFTKKGPIDMEIAVSESPICRVEREEVGVVGDSVGSRTAKR